MMLIMLFCLKVLRKLNTEFNFTVVRRLPYKVLCHTIFLVLQKVWKAMKLQHYMMQRAPGLCHLVILVLRPILLSISK